jgi:hypothetical protein
MHGSNDSNLFMVEGDAPFEFLAGFRIETIYAARRLGIFIFIYRIFQCIYAI